MKRLLPIGLVALIFSLFLASTPEAQVRIVRGFRAAITFVVNGLGTTTTAGLTLENQTAAALGAQQYSPRFSQIGQGFATSTTASMPVELGWEVRPVQGAAAPSYEYYLTGRVNQGAWSTLVYTNNSGDWIASGNIAVAAAQNFAHAGRSYITAPGLGLYNFHADGDVAGLRFQFAGVPSITTIGAQFGGSASILTGSTDTFGFIRVGAATEGVIAFATDWGTNLQQGCTANNEDGTPTYVQVTDKTMRLAGGTRAVPVAWTSSSVVNWVCGGSR